MSILLRPRALCALALLAFAAPAVALPRFGTQEIVLRSNLPYDGDGGVSNPFDVTLAARVTAPDGRVLTVPGFYDGDGAGGMDGNVFKIRIFGDVVGTWRWTTSSSNPSLAGKSGSFSVSGRLAGRFGEGPLEVDPAHPRSFRRRLGGPVFLVGKFLDQAAPAGLQYSHTFLSEELSDADRAAMLARHEGMHLNVMNLYVANRGDYGGVSTTPWLGSAASNDKRRFDLARWRRFDTWVKRLRDEGMAAHLWLFADDSGFGDLPNADRERLIRYAMARLSGYANTMWCLALEWQEGWSTTEVAHHANVLHGANPWNRLVTVHGTPGDFRFPTATWADLMDVQAGNSAGHGTVNASTLRHRGKAAKPVIQEEHGLGKEDTRHRQNAWAAFTGGAAGVGTGAFLRHLADFAATVPFAEMAPANGKLVSGNGYLLAKPGQIYVAYLPAGGTAKVDLRGASGSFAVRWLNPRTGVATSAASASGGGTVARTPPGSGDWVLVLERSATGTAVFSSGFEAGNLSAWDAAAVD